MHAEERFDPFFAIVDGPNGNGGEDADETEYGQPVQHARDGIVGLWTCSGHNVSLFFDLFGFLNRRHCNKNCPTNYVAFLKRFRKCLENLKKQRFYP